MAENETSTSLEGCVRNLVAELEGLGVGDETREVNGADAVDLLNRYLPQLRAGLAEARA